jgi:hypothetical protein
LLNVHGQANDRSGQLTEEFHHVYPLSANGRLELDNINGAVHITAWDRDEVKVDAVKYARVKERLDEAKIVVEANANSVSIRTEYPRYGHINANGSDNPASVEYTLMVPAHAHLDEIKLINGALDIQGVAGEVHASCINGHLSARGLAGPVKLSTINGKMEAEVDRLQNSPVELSSVNGGLNLTIPSDSKADLEASSMQGDISDDFGLRVHHHFIGHNMRGEIGGGGTRIKLSDVNGRIEIRHNSDGRALSPSKDSDGDDHNRDDIYGCWPVSAGMISKRQPEKTPHSYLLLRPITHHSPAEVRSKCETDLDYPLRHSKVIAGPFSRRTTFDFQHSQHRNYRARRSRQDHSGGRHAEAERNVSLK